MSGLPLTFTRRRDLANDPTSLSVDYGQARAEEARVKAEAMTDIEARRTMLRVVEMRRWPQRRRVVRAEIRLQIGGSYLEVELRPATSAISSHMDATSSIILRPSWSTTLGALVRASAAFRWQYSNLVSTAFIRRPRLASRARPTKRQSGESAGGPLTCRSERARGKPCSLVNKLQSTSAVTSNSRFRRHRPGGMSCVQY